MKPRHQATRAAIELIKRFEGFRAKAARLPDASGWTIGYGHTRTAREGASVSEPDADALLIYDTAAVVQALNEWVYSPLTQNQFDSLVAFAFSVGLPNFRRSSVLRRLNEGAYLQAACAMEMWRTADFEGERIVVDALVRRRSAEITLFLTPQDGYIPVPSMVVLPHVDEQVAMGAPLASTQIETPLEGSIAAMVLSAGEQPVDPSAASRAAMDAVSERLNALLQAAPPAAAAPEPLFAASVSPVGEEAVVEEAPESLFLRTVAETAHEPVIHAEPEQVFETAYHAEPEAEAEQAHQPEEELPPYDPMTYAAAQASYQPEPIYAPSPQAGSYTAHVEYDDEDEDEGGFDDMSLDTHPALQPLVFRGRPTGSLTLRRKGKRAPAPILALMGVAGLGIAGGGVFWGVNADAAERLAGLPSPEVAGLGVSLAGIAMLGASVYLLLRRMATRD